MILPLTCLGQDAPLGKINYLGMHRLVRQTKSMHTVNISNFVRCIFVFKTVAKLIIVTQYNYNLILFRNQIFFNQFNVKRLPNYPNDTGNDAAVMFYVDYPMDVKSGSIPKTILASIIFSQLQRLRNLTGLTIVLNTPVTPAAPADPTEDQRANAVVLQMLHFSTAQV